MVDHKIGHIQANNIEDPESQDSIKIGFTTGDGLLGLVYCAFKKLEKAASDYGYFSDDYPQHLDKLEEARLDFYNTLKMVEKRGNDLETENQKLKEEIKANSERYYLVDPIGHRAVDNNSTLIQIPGSLAKHMTNIHMGTEEFNPMKVSEWEKQFG